MELGGLDAQEKDIAQGFEMAQKEINRLVEFQEKIRKEIGKPKAEVALSEPDRGIESGRRGVSGGQIGGCRLSARAKWSNRTRSAN